MTQLITWDSFARRLPDGDLIDVVIEENAVDAGTVEFRLEAGSLVTWWKSVLVPDGLGSSWEPWTQGDVRMGAVSLWADQVNNLQELQFSKAKLLGVHTAVYRLGGLERLNPGSRVTFRWVQDTERQLRAWARSVNLSVPRQGGTWRANAGQQMQATVELWNMSDEDVWSPEVRIKLGSWNPRDNLTWGVGRVELTENVPAFGAARFEFIATVPSDPGEYRFAWRMLQEGVRWFGEPIDTLVVVAPPPPPPPPPPPTAGVITLSLAQQPASWFMFDATTPDPSISVQYPASRHATATSLANPAHTFYLSHLDRTGREAGPVLLRPGDTTSAFDGLMVEGMWQAEFRGVQAEAPPQLLVNLSWSAPP